jgi:hypothetical protein
LETIAQEELRQECRFLCTSVLKITPCAATLDRYVEAHQILFTQSIGEGVSSSPFDSLVSEAIKRGQDIEALEYALRWQQEITVLTKKLHMLLYIIEIHPVHHKLFVNASNSVLKGYVILGYEIVRSLYKLLKGRMMLYLSTGTN